MTVLTKKNRYCIITGGTHYGYDGREWFSSLRSAVKAFRRNDHFIREQGITGHTHTQQLMVCVYCVERKKS